MTLVLRPASYNPGQKFIVQRLDLDADMAPFVTQIVVLGGGLIDGSSIINLVGGGSSVTLIADELSGSYRVISFSGKEDFKKGISLIS